MIEPKNYKWFIEYTSPEEGHLHGLRTILHTSQTKYQKMDIAESGSYGRCLILDGKIQSTEQDEFIYHEALVHPAMLTHPNPKRVFIVGGGEGATLRDVLKHKSVDYCMMVDIDQEVVEKSKEYLPEWSAGAFDDPRTDLRYMDARKYLEETSDSYDVIIIDISEPVEEGPAYLLFTREFYEIVKERLSPDGVISLQAGTTALHQLLNFTAVNKTLSAVFPVVAPYDIPIPSFGLPWGFTLASKNIDPRKWSPRDVDDMIAKRIKGSPRFYDGIAHLGLFNLPKHVRTAMAAQTKIIEDNAPLFSYH
jgi:spermidine synthase